MIDVSMLEGLEIADQREHSTPHLWAKLAKWKRRIQRGRSSSASAICGGI